MPINKKKNKDPPGHNPHNSSHAMSHEKSTDSLDSMHSQFTDSETQSDTSHGSSTELNSNLFNHDDETLSSQSSPVSFYSQRDATSLSGGHAFSIHEDFFDGPGASMPSSSQYFSPITATNHYSEPYFLDASKISNLPLYNDLFTGNLNLNIQSPVNLSPYHPDKKVRSWSRMQSPQIEDHALHISMGRWKNDPSLSADEIYDFKTSINNLRSRFNKTVNDVLGADLEHCIIAENSAANPFFKVGLNTAATFCNLRSGKYHEQFSIIRQCCEQATRRDGISMVFLNAQRNQEGLHNIRNKPKEIDEMGKNPGYDTYFSSGNATETMFYVAKLPDDLTSIARCIEDVYATETDFGKKSSLILNVGIVHVALKNSTDYKRIALMTGNGIYDQKKGTKVMQTLASKIDCIPNLDITTLVIPLNDNPIAKSGAKVNSLGKPVHCETIFSDIISSDIQQQLDTPPLCFPVTDDGFLTDEMKQAFVNPDQMATPFQRKRNRVQKLPSMREGTKHTKEKVHFDDPMSQSINNKENDPSRSNK